MRLVNKQESIGLIIYTNSTSNRVTNSRGTKNKDIPIVYDGFHSIKSAINLINPSFSLMSFMSSSSLHHIRSTNSNKSPRRDLDRDTGSLSFTRRPTLSLHFFSRSYYPLDLTVSLATYFC